METEACVERRAERPPYQIKESAEAGFEKVMAKAGGFGKFGNPEELAALLGLSEDELKAEMKEGQSLAEIAAAKELRRIN